MKSFKLKVVTIFHNFRKIFPTKHEFSTELSEYHAGNFIQLGQN